MDVPGLIAWLAEDHPAAVLLTTVGTVTEASRILYANPAFAKLSGYTRGEVLGQSPRLLQGPRTDTRAARLLAAAARAGRAARAVLVNYRRDGTEYLCEVALQPMRADGAVVTHMLGLAREVRRRRGRPAGEGLRFFPVADALGLAAFGRTLAVPLPLQAAEPSFTGTSRGSTAMASALTRTIA